MRANPSSQTPRGQSVQVQNTCPFYERPPNGNLGIARYRRDFAANLLAVPGLASQDWAKLLLLYQDFFSREL